MSAHQTGWKVYSLRTTTGEVGSEYDPVSGSWGIDLNKTETIRIEVQKSELRNREKLWWMPWSGGVLFTYTGQDGVEEPIVAGPIYDYEYETTDTLTFLCGGIRKILERRLVWSDLSFKNMAYGDMAWGLVSHGMDKPGGKLPIIHGTPSENGRFEKNYQRWNLANNDIDKLLTDLSELQRGPDIMFRPQWADEDHTRIVWVMVNGTQLNPSIPQNGEPDFDTTAAKADIGAPTISSSAKYVNSRVWVTGSGEGEGVVRVYAENLVGVQNGMPFLETVISASDQSEQGALQAKANGALVSPYEMVDQVTFTVRANSRKHPLGSYHVGDTAQVTLKGWLNIPDGTRPMKIISANGDFTDAVTLDFQEDRW